MNKSPILKNIIKYNFIASGFLPAHCLLFGAAYLLLGPLLLGGIENIRFDKETIIFYGSLIIGIFGYFGLLLSMIPIPENDFILKMKIPFLILGIIGFIIFSTQEDHHFDDLLESFSTDIFTFDWFIFCWPNVVSLVLIVYFLVKLFSLKKRKTAHFKRRR